VKPISIEIDNLYSIGHIEESLENRGLLLVSGYSKDDHTANGSGKSSFANKCLVWTKYGKTLSGHTVPVNRYTSKKSGYGRYVFQTNDSPDQRYRITRGKNPSTLKLEQRVMLPDTWVDISAKKMSDTQSMIDLLLGRNFDTFSQTDAFGQGRMLDYIQLTPKARKEVLEQILPMEMLDQWAGHSEEALGVLHKKINELAIKKNKADIEKRVIQEQITSLTARSISWEQTHEAAYRALVELQEQEEKRLDRLPVELVMLQKQAEDLRAVAPLEVVNRTLLETKANQIDAERRKAEQVQFAWNGKWKSLHPHEIAGICPTCGQQTPAEAVAELLAKNVKIGEEKEDAFAKMNQAKAVVDAKREEWLEVHRQLEVRDKADAANRKRENDIHKLEIEIAAIEKRLIGVRDFEAELRKLGREENPYKEQIQELQHQLAPLILFDFKEQEDSIMHQMQIVDFWNTKFKKTLKLRLFEAACPFLDRRVAHHLKGLNCPQFMVKFSTLKVLASGEVKEEFDVQVESSHGGSNYHDLSGGEQQLVNFAVGLALADLASSQTATHSGLQILDEPFVELDANNCENVVNYLTSYLFKHKETILLISNDAALMGLIPNRLFIVKEHGVSSVERS
jgi:DNA repair exonuclease SbcCD ATPase subunit